MGGTGLEHALKSRQKQALQKKAVRNPVQLIPI